MMIRIIWVVMLLLFIHSVSLFAQETVSYESEDFSFDYDKMKWELTESDSGISLRHDGSVLRMLVDNAPTGLPAGEFERLKYIGLYGIPVDVLKFDGKIKQVLYGQLKSHDMSLTILLDVPINEGVTYDEVDISRAVIDDASRIVSSMLFHNIEPREVTVTPFFDGQKHPVDDWQSYFHAEEPFGFRYPDSWTLTEEPNRIILDNGLARFTIGFSPLENDPPSINPELFLISNMDVRVPIYGMYQLIESQTINPHDNLVQAVIYQNVTTSENQFLMWIETTSDTQLDNQIMDEVDLIISTFKTTPPK